MHITKDMIKKKMYEDGFGERVATILAQMSKEFDDVEMEAALILAHSTYRQVVQEEGVTFEGYTKGDK
jgi:hypothetical protein